MTIGLLLAEPWSMTMTQPAAAEASATLASTSTSTASAVTAATHIARTSRGLAPAAQSTSWVGPPAKYYAVIDLGPLGDFDFVDMGTQPPNADIHGTMGINNLGEVVYGRNVGSDTIRAFVWLPNDNYGLECYNPHHGADAWGRFDLNELIRESSSTLSIARDINDAGMVVGQFGDVIANLNADPSDGIVWDLSDETNGIYAHELLPLFVYGFWVAPHAINNDATPTIVGAADDERTCACHDTVDPSDEQLVRPFSWVLGDTDLKNLGLSDVGPDDELDAAQGEARDVSITIGQGTRDAVGNSYCNFIDGTAQSECLAQQVGCGGDFRANRWDVSDTTPAAVALKGIPHTTKREGFARGINDVRNVVGFGRDEAILCPRRALFWRVPDSQENPIVIGDEMPSQQGGDPSRAEAINNSCRNHIVGWNETAQRAVRWTRSEDGNFNDWDAVDLTSIIRYCEDDWEIVEAHDINDEGWIAAWGYNLDNDPQAEDPRAVVLIPVPHHPGDLNGDGVVDVLDLLIVIAEWGTKCNELDCPEFCDGDGNGDGIVNVQDLLLVISNWSATLDPCDFEPDIDCYSHPGGGGTGSGPTAAPFGDLLDAWEFDDWDDVEQWMETADPQDIQDFLDDLEDAANQL